MAILVYNRKGRPVTLLNPKEKNDKFASEMRNDIRLTNNAEVKGYGLTAVQKAYRAGYRECFKDTAKAYYSKYKSQYSRKRKK